MSVQTQLNYNPSWQRIANGNTVRLSLIGRFQGKHGIPPFAISKGYVQQVSCYVDVLLINNWKQKFTNWPVLCSSISSLAFTAMQDSSLDRETAAGNVGMLATKFSIYLYAFLQNKTWPVTELYIVQETVKPTAILSYVQQTVKTIVVPVLSYSSANRQKQYYERIHLQVQLYASLTQTRRCYWKISDCCCQSTVDLPVLLVSSEEDRGHRPSKIHS